MQGEVASCCSPLFPSLFVVLSCGDNEARLLSSGTDSPPPQNSQPHSPSVPVVPVRLGFSKRWPGLFLGFCSVRVAPRHAWWCSATLIFAVTCSVSGRVCETFGIFFQFSTRGVVSLTRGDLHFLKLF